MGDDKLESFKIGDTRPAAAVGSGASAKTSSAGAQTDDTPSLGFNRIENLLETADPDAVTGSLQTVYDQLSELQEQAKGARDKAAARKAMVAIERVSDLMGYLYDTKEQLQNA